MRWRQERGGCVDTARVDSLSDWSELDPVSPDRPKADGEACDRVSRAHEASGAGPGHGTEHELVTASAGHQQQRPASFWRFVVMSARAAALSHGGWDSTRQTCSHVKFLITTNTSAALCLRESSRATSPVAESCEDPWADPASWLPP